MVLDKYSAKEITVAANKGGRLDAHFSIYIVNRGDAAAGYCRVELRFTRQIQDDSRASGVSDWFDRRFMEHWSWELSNGEIVWTGENTEAIIPEARRGNPPRELCQINHVHMSPLGLGESLEHRIKWSIITAKMGIRGRDDELIVQLKGGQPQTKGG